MGVSVFTLLVEMHVGGAVMSSILGIVNKGLYCLVVTTAMGVPWLRRTPWSKTESSPLG